MTFLFKNDEVEIFNICIKNTHLEKDLKERYAHKLDIASLWMQLWADRKESELWMNDLSFGHQ